MAETPTFPTALFAFDEQEVDIERRVISGGISLSGEQDLIATDGGGRVFAEFASGPLLEREQQLAWRALATMLEDGAAPIIVPFCDKFHQPYGYEHNVPHSDQTSFTDDTLYSGGGPAAVVSESKPLRATSVRLSVNLPQPLIGGEWFAIEHPNKGWRAYRIATILAQTNIYADVTFRPPFREAVEAGTPADLSEPKCLMRVDGRLSTRTELGRYGEANVRFVEAP